MPIIQWRVLVQCCIFLSLVCVQGWFGVAGYQQPGNQSDLTELPKAASEGNLFDHAYDVALSQLYAPVNEALSQTHQIIAGRCEGQGVTHADINKVFDQTQVGRSIKNHSQLYQTSPTQEVSFQDACVNVVSCYHRDELQARQIERDEFTAYTTQTRQSCLGVVTALYRATYQTASTHQLLQNQNYGDDLYTNGYNDGPYDLIQDIQEIGDHLFVNNAPAPQISTYNLPQGVWTSNNATPSDESNGGSDSSSSSFTNADQQGSQALGSNGSAQESDSPYRPVQMSREDRYLPSVGVPPALPTTSTVQYPYPNATPSGSSDTISPQRCLPEGTYQETLPPPSYQDVAAETERVQQKLQNVAYSEVDLGVLLAQRYTRSEEELLGDDDPTNDPDPLARELQPYEADLDGSSLDAVKDHVQGCIEQFTDKGTSSRQKVLADSITQPGEFANCVFEGLCNQSSDPSGLGIFTVKICKEPKKVGGVQGNKTVKSVESIIDTLNTTCNGLQESGQLLKHNQTKDHRDHKLMNIKLQDVFSFGLSVSYADPKNVRDFAQEKRKQIQSNALLEKRLLGINDKYTSLQQRNKYRIIRGGFEPTGDGETSLTEADQVRETLAAANADYQDAKALPRQSQQLGTVAVTSQLSTFIEDNIAFWEVANQQTESLQSIWGSAYLKFNQ